MCCEGQKTILSPVSRYPVVERAAWVGPRSASDLKNDDFALPACTGLKLVQGAGVRLYVVDAPHLPCQLRLIG